MIAANLDWHKWQFAVLLFCSITVPQDAVRPSLVTVTVEQAVVVSRGCSVDLRPALRFNLAQAVNCRVTSISGSSCGSIIPDIFDCSTYSGPILYQHFGCFSTQELATFTISTLPAGYSPPSPSSSLLQPVQVSTHSVEVVVASPPPGIAALRVQATRKDPPNEALNLTVAFPPGLVGRCYYEVVSAWPVLSLPIAGNLSGIVNQVLPGGYVPTSPLTYQSQGLMGCTDYILVKIYLHKARTNAGGNGTGIAYAILPFGAESASAEPVQLERDVLIINQAVNTPISWSNFNFTLNRPPGRSDSLPLLRYTFPVLESGSMRSLYSTSAGVPRSSFTSQDLLAGHVAFYPTDVLSSSNPVIYHYNVTNVAGILVARGGVNILVRERVWNYPTQRRNCPLAVAEGGMTAINQSVLDFYPTYECDLSTTMEVLQPPAHGVLVYENGSRVGQEKIYFWLLRNTTLLRYRHDGGEELGDTIYWEVKCPSAATDLVVFMSVLVAAVDDVPPTLVIPSPLRAYRNWVLPLSPSFLQAMDPDSAHSDIIFVIHHKTLLRTSRNVGNFDNTSILFPLIASNSLVPSLGRDFMEVHNFSLLELEQQKIWYVPKTASVDTLELTVRDSANHENPRIYTLYITVSSLAPNHTLLISTSTQYPHVLANKPLPLSSRGHMYLTPYFLYSRAPPSSSKAMRYVVTLPPQHGLLCLLPLLPLLPGSGCTQSVDSFTQHDVNYHLLIYQRGNSGGEQLLPDSFSFLATVQGVSHIRPVTNTFNWTVLQPSTVLLLDRPFWLRVETEKLIPPEVFYAFSALPLSRNLTFRIREQPRYGDLMLRNSTQHLAFRPLRFTFEDVRNRLLWYSHSQHRGPRVCSDEVVFDASSPLQNVVTARLPIILQDGDTDLRVVTTPHILQGITHFTFSSRDFNVSSSFCPKFVTFRLDRAPSLGVLNLKDHTHKTTRQLQVDCTFTAEDIQSEALSYSIPRPDPGTNFTDDFVVTASDPSSEWPVLSSMEAPGRFEVRFVAPPSAKLVVRFSSGHPLTWLAEHQSYGYAFSAHDIDLLNSTLEPGKVIVQVEKELAMGRLEKEGVIVAFFTVADLQEGTIVYLKNSRRLDVRFREHVTFGVYAYSASFSRRASLHRFLVEWAVVDLEGSGVIGVLEPQGTLQLAVRCVLESYSLWYS